MAEDNRENLDWLFPNAAEQKAQQVANAIKFANLYLIFDSGVGAQLLAHWINEIENRDIAPNASHQEYAYWEGRRVFVRGIQRQILLAKNRGDLPH